MQKKSPQRSILEKYQTSKHVTKIKCKGTGKKKHGD